MTTFSDSSSVKSTKAAKAAIPLSDSMGTIKVRAQSENIRITRVRHNRAIARARAARQAARRAAARAAAAVPAPTPAQTMAAAVAPQGDPQQTAESMLGSYGWSTSEFSCLQPLWNAESGWNVYASNAGSGAYGIPQALPGSKMSSAGPDWQTDAATQIRWGLGYIKGDYGTPCAAWAHEQADGWY